MLTANETIAVLKAWPATAPNRDGGGNDGAGMLDTTTKLTRHKNHYNCSNFNVLQ